MRHDHARRQLTQVPAHRQAPSIAVYIRRAPRLAWTRLVSYDPRMCILQQLLQSGMQLTPRLIAGDPAYLTAPVEHNKLGDIQDVVALDQLARFVDIDLDE